MFTSESLSLIRILSPSSIFLCTTIASIFAYFKCIVSFCCSRENETWKHNPEQWEAFTCNDETSDKKLTNCSPNFTALLISIILKLKGYIKGRLISRILNFKKKSIERFKNYLPVDQNIQKPLTRAPGYILIKNFFLAIGWSYLHDLSYTFLKRLKLLWGEIACQKRFIFYR